MSSAVTTSVTLNFCGSFDLGVAIYSCFADKLLRLGRHSFLLGISAMLRVPVGSTRQLFVNFFFFKS